MDSKQKSFFKLWNLQEHQINTRGCLEVQVWLTDAYHFLLHTHTAAHGSKQTHVAGTHTDTLCLL